MLSANTYADFNMCLRMCSQEMSAVNPLIRIALFPPQFAVHQRWQFCELHLTENYAQVLTELLKTWGFHLTHF